MKIYVGNSSYPEYFVLKNSLDNAVFITDNEKKAKECFLNFLAYKEFFSVDKEILFIPSSKDVLDLESQIERNYALTRWIKGEVSIIVFSIEALDIKLRTFDEFCKSLIKIEKGKEINREEFVENLLKSGYIKEDYPENEGEFSVKGGYISINIPKIGIVDVDFFGDEIEGLYLKSKLFTRKEINNITIYPLYDFEVASQNPLKLKDEPYAYLKDYLSGEIYTVDVFEDLNQKSSFFSNLVSKSIGTTKDVDESYTVYKIPLKNELVLKEEKLAFLPEVENKNLQLDVEPIKEGDYIIHEEYGIGIFRGIETREIRGKVYDFMILEYAEGEKVFVSYLHFDKIHKYKSQSVIKIDKIGAPSWRNLKKKVKESLRNIARQLIKIYAERQSIKRPPLEVENELIDKFEREFPYIETPDQSKAIKDIKKDLMKDKPMERLICGDVGFGKTEVAIRATFIHAVNGYQTLILVPTTVLAYQHYIKFKERLEKYGLIVENLSRLKSKSQQLKIVEDLKNGKIDVIVATHKGLSEEVQFKNLGLLIIDEEHRFGVRAKEKIKQIKKDVDTLYLTATPIPRTLNMALSGLKDISVINTPPEGRYEVKTFVSPFDEEVLKKAIEFELKRKGQVFYIHNKVETISDTANYIKSLFKNANVDFVHGQMRPSEIEKKILSFIEGKVDILVATSIIETGIDIPTANTLIVERADLFGLAQLYHLRGRVGRGNIQAYCYLFVPNHISKDAQKRIDAILRLTRPGSGLKVSMEDLQIRGPGNILGVEQSGFVKSVGFDMYVKLLKEAIKEEKGEKEFETQIEVDFDYYIPQSLIKDPSERLNIYLAISKAESYEDIDKIRKYLKEFYNDIPKIFNIYLTLEKIKRVLSEMKIQKFSVKENIGYLGFSKETFPEVVSNLIKHLKPYKIDTYGIYFNLSTEDLEKISSIFENTLKSVKIE
ncbi:DEAD/DEAH box helicase [Sulfurihydrogenibium sp.]|uniref:DEAD/DEAH box helicase n=1 Tax=Sulfurihydrogenibium sp. TaxID=2053621 RepID=UPI0026166B52|nr:DEAD/DEAH box helicase [Sulfurihydrogenibium sp.]